jgi:CubicO group peptidase (beta-lactamase class C family)
MYRRGRRTGRSGVRFVLTAALLGIITCVLLVLIEANAAEASTHRTPSGRWAAPPFPCSTPEDQGMDSRLLAESIDFLLGQRDLYNIHSMSVVRHGHLVADVSFWPYQPGTMHHLASTTKVVMSTLIGIAIDHGYIAGVNEPVVDFFPDRDIANMDHRKRALTIEHLLTHTSGLGSDDDIDTAAMEATSDWVQYALDLPMSHDPGTTWNYHQPSVLLLSAILSQTTGISALEFAAETLFGPLGVTTSAWFASPQGVTNGYSELRLSPHSLAAFGQMILQGGTWAGEQLVSQSWVSTATSRLVDDFQGYMWSHYPEYDSFFIGGGAKGQRLVVSPTHDLVVVFTGGGYAHADIESVYLEALSSYIFAAVQSDEPLPPSPSGEALLEDAVRTATSVDREPAPLQPLPDIVAEVSGRTCVMDDNWIGLRTFTLTFPTDSEARLLVTATGEITADRVYEFAAGLDGIERLAYGRLGIPAAGMGRWENDSTFVMEVDELGNLIVLRLTFVFEDDLVTATMEDMDWWQPRPPIVLTGTLQDRTRAIDGRLRSAGADSAKVRAGTLD